MGEGELLFGHEIVHVYLRQLVSLIVNISYLLSNQFVLNAFANMHIFVFMLFSLRATCFCTFSGNHLNNFSNDLNDYGKPLGCFGQNIRMNLVNHLDDFTGRTEKKEKENGKKAPERPLNTILTPHKLYEEDLL